MKKKERKAFFKIKKKLILVPPKKFLGRKFLGIILLVCGSLTLAGSIIYFYLVPNFFSGETKTAEVKETKTPFLAKRILVPALTLDFPVKDGEVTIQPPLKLREFKMKEEIIVLSENEYRSYRAAQSNIKDGSVEPMLSVSDSNLKLILPIKITPPTILTVEAELAE